MAALLLCSVAVQAALPPESPDRILLKAHQAWNVRDADALVRYSRQLARDPLADYVHYWLLDVRLGQPENVPDSDLTTFFQHYSDSPLADPLRVTWLKKLGSTGQWDTFAAQVTPAALEDPTVACYQLQARLRRQDTAVAAAREGRSLWQRHRMQPDSCDPVFRLLVAQNTIPQDDLWNALRQALGNDNLVLARYVNSFLSPQQGLDENALTLAYTQPATFLDSGDNLEATPGSRELILFAVGQLAARDPQQAADTWMRLETRFNPRDQSYGWLQVAWQGAQQQHPNALAWFDRAGNALLDDRMRAWRTRAALRQENWEEVLHTINGMSPAEAGKSAWRYWKGRALRTLGQGEEARALWLPLSRESNYYGLLALEELGGQLVLPAAPATPAAAEIDAIRPHLDRALRLHTLGLEPESRFEWNAVNRPLTPRQHLTAATLAQQAQWYDRAIYSVERAGDQGDMTLEYPLAFEDSVRQQSQQQQLDEAWVLGLVRQESYFSPQARSRTGAMGLMQLMPATARWVAQHIPVRRFRWSQATQVETNLRLGTYYLHQLLRQLGDPVLATASYNAGPHRVLRWVPGLPLEAPIFIETIPVNETRGYVQHVLFNTAVYALRLGQPPLSLHQRLGVIQGGARAHNNEPDPAAQP